jgi:hypothetical protein
VDILDETVGTLADQVQAYVKQVGATTLVLSSADLNTLKKYTHLMWITEIGKRNGWAALASFAASLCTATSWWSNILTMVDKKMGIKLTMYGIRCKKVTRQACPWIV